MLIFDAFIGNNDRHFYNWGIIRNLLGNEKPIFSPIYDTARGLFWNYTEKEVNKIYNNKTRLDTVIKKYSEKSKPKTGWEDKSNINHFDLLENMKSEPVNLTKAHIREILNNNALKDVISLIDNEFNMLLSKERRTLIKKCLEYRYERIIKIF